MPLKFAHAAIANARAASVDLLRAPGGWLLAIFLAVLLLTWLKTLAVFYPVAFGDESTYSLLAKFGADPRVIARIGLIDDLPNHLYFSIYQAAYFLGDNFLAGAKLLNSLAIAAGIFPIYLLCRIYLPLGASVALAAISVLGPISSYATYFTPEALYFFGFWVYAYLSLRHVDKPVIAQGVLGGGLLGMLVLIKPHAVMLLPSTAVLCAVVLWKKLDSRATVVRLLVAWVGAVAGFTIARIVLFYVLTGQMQFSFLGPTYTTFVADSTRFADSLTRMLDYLVLLRGHASLVLLAYFSPLMILAVYMIKRFAPGRGRRSALALEPSGTALFVFGITVLALTIGMTVKFSVDIATVDPYQIATRLHGRYYSFALPFIPICAVLVLERYHSSLALKGPLLRSIVVAAVLAALAYAASAMLEPFPASLGVVDFPDPFYLREPWPRFWALLVAVMVTVYLLGPTRHAATCFLVYWTAITGVATIAAQHWAVTAIHASYEDRYPLAVKNLLRPDEIDSGLIVASTYADSKVFRVMFHLNSLSRVIIAPKGAVLGESRIDPDREWLLLLDDYRVVVPSQTILKGDGFELIRLSKTK